VCLFIQVLGELGCVTVISEGVFVFIVTCEEAPSDLTYISLLAVCACEFVNS